MADDLTYKQTTDIFEKSGYEYKCLFDAVKTGWRIF